MNEKDKAVLEYLGIYDEVKQYGKYVKIAKRTIIPDNDKAYVRVILLVTNDKNKEIKIY